MTNQSHHSDELERLIAEVQEFEQAGVFKRTPVDVAAVVEADGGRRPGLTHRLFVGLQVAACVGLVVGLVAVWRVGQPSDRLVGLTDSSGTEVAAAIGALRSERIATLAGCFSGPAGGPLGEECSCVDYDGDGDVDLADYGAFQRAYTQSP